MKDSTVGTTQQFVALSRRLKAAGEGKGKDSLRGQMMAELRAIAQPIVNDARRSALALQSSAKGDSDASARRAAHMLKGRKNQDEKAIVRALGKSSLRQAVARSLRIVVKDNGFSQQVGVRVTTDGSRLPAGQQYLPRGLDIDKGWRHPTFGHKDRRVTQYGNPSGWFRSTARAHHPMAIRRVDAVLRRYMERIPSDVNRAA